MGTFSIWHWIIVLIIVVLVFGTKKLRNMGSDLGNAIKGFKDGMKESDSENTMTQSTHTDKPIIEVEAKKEVTTHTFKESGREAHRTSENFSAASAQANESSKNNTNNQTTDAGTEIKEKTQAKT